MPSSSRGRRIVYVVAALLPLWALVAYATGGLGWQLGPLRISSRQPLRPFLIGAALWVYYFWRYPRLDRQADGAWLQEKLTRVGWLAVPLLAAAAFALGVIYGSFAAGGSDSYGYVSQARLWLDGQLRVAQPWVEKFAWPNREWMFSPLGYQPVSDDGTIAPTYPPGLPLLMSVFLAVFGANGPFYVVPLAGAVLVWLTWRLGRETTGSTLVGFLAALLMLSSPVFLAHETVPMSEVPAAAAWALAAFFAFRQRSLSSGLAAAAALIIRPNLIALAFMPVVIWRGRKEPLPRYGVGLLPGVLFVFGLNLYLYGGPLTAGYRPFIESFGVSGGLANVRNYVVWIIQTQTPLVLLAALPLAVKDGVIPDNEQVSYRDGLAALVLLTFASYVFYGVFDHWLYLRLLLPAYPALFILTAAAIRWIASKLPIEVQGLATAAACGWIVVAGLSVGRYAGIFNQAEFEQRFVRTAERVAETTPAGAAVLTVQHSGSVRYYANRVTVRYDWLPENRLDAVVHDLKANGYQPYLVLEDWEEEDFRARFGPHGRLGKLDWPPLARVPGRPEVRIYAMNE